jgi:hypothetical protein
VRRAGALLVVAAALLAAGVATPAAERLEVGRFEAPAAPDALPAGWERLTFRRIARATRYAVVREDDGWVLRADADRSAAALYRALDLDPRAYPRLTWRWKVAGVVTTADARRKAGDDYAARVYVAFRYDPATATAWERARYGAYRLVYGVYPPRAVLNYVWDNRLPPGTALDNAYTDRAKMLVLRTGTTEVGRWLTETRNVVDDYRRLFGGEPPRIAGVAVMTDTDDTGERATAWYAGLAFLGAE